MTRKQIYLAIAVIAAAVLAYFLTAGSRQISPESSVAEEHGGEEQVGLGGTVKISAEQLRSAEIELVQVGAATATELTLSATVNATPNGSARVDARAGGVVQSIAKNLGDPVRRGETLARIESAEAAALAAQLASARARVVELDAAYARERQLFDANVTARQDLEAALANLSVARSELSRAQAAVAAAGVSGDGRSLAVTSPINGTITAVPAVLGSFVTAGEELFRIVDPSRLQIEAAVAAADASRIAVGDEAVIALPGGGQTSARVRSITPSLDADSRTAVAVLSLRRGLQGLQPGAFVEVRIAQSAVAADGSYSVPDDSVQSIEGRDVVFVQVPQGFRVQPVRVAARSAGRVTILSGLTGNEMIAGRNAFLIKAELGKAGAEHDD